MTPTWSSSTAITTTATSNPPAEKNRSLCEAGLSARHAVTNAGSVKPGEDDHSDRQIGTATRRIDGAGSDRGSLEPDDQAYGQA